jgi:hypothetical protein
MATIEEEIQMIKTAHSRLFNQLKQLESDFNSLIVDSNLCNTNIANSIKDLQEQLVELRNTQPPKVKPALIIDNVYRERISEIISGNKVEWNNGQYMNYEIKLKDREEIFNAFISIKYRLVPGFIIKFTYSDNSKLKNIRIIE